MNNRFKDKTVVITNASNHIGKASAIKFANEGANVVLIGNDKEKLIELSEFLPEDNSWLHEQNYLTITCDINDLEQLKKMALVIIEEYEKIDIFINQVCSEEQAIFTIDMPVSEAIFSYLNSVNGSLINVNACLNLAELHSLEDITKKTQTMVVNAHKNNMKKLRINTISYLEHPSTDQSLSSDNYLFSPDKVINAVADAIGLLASDDASMITGVNIPVDAGQRFTSSNL